MFNDLSVRSVARQDYDQRLSLGATALALEITQTTWARLASWVKAAAMRSLHRHATHQLSDGAASCKTTVFIQSTMASSAEASI
jgi:hypothetical protein